LDDLEINVSGDSHPSNGVKKVKYNQLLIRTFILNDEAPSPLLRQNLTEIFIFERIYYYRIIYEDLSTTAQYFGEAAFFLSSSLVVVVGY
jgi:hypothetical protein